MDPRLVLSLVNIPIVKSVLVHVREEIMKIVRVIWSLGKCLWSKR